MRREEAALELACAILTSGEGQLLEDAPPVVVKHDEDEWALDPPSHLERSQVVNEAHVAQQERHRPRARTCGPCSARDQAVDPARATLVKNAQRLRRGRSPGIELPYDGAVTDRERGSSGTALDDDPRDMPRPHRRVDERRIRGLPCAVAAANERVAKRGVAWLFGDARRRREDLR